MANYSSISFNIFVLQGVFRRWVNNIESSLLHIFYDILKYIIYPVSKNTLDHGSSNPWEEPETSNAKAEHWLMSSGKPRAVDNMHSFYDLSLRNLLLHLFEITCFQKHTDGDFQTWRCRGKVYSHVKNNLVYTQLFSLITKGTICRY